MIKLNKAPTLTHRYKSSKYNPNLSSASKVKPSDCRKDKPNGKMKNDNKSYSKVSFSSNISIPNLKPLSNKEITHALYYDSEIEDSKQFIKNKYRTLLEHFSSN